MKLTGTRINPDHNKGRAIKALECIDRIPGSKLEALRFILCLPTSDDAPVIETDLTEEEREIICAGREEYKAGGYIPLVNL